METTVNSPRADRPPSGLPTSRGVAASLRLLSDKDPFTEQDIYDRYDLLVLPCLAHEADFSVRARLFRDALELAVSALPEPEKILARRLLLHSHRQKITERRYAAADEMVNARAYEELPSNRVLDRIERQMLEGLSETLLDPSFAERFRATLGVGPLSTLPGHVDSPVGYYAKEHFTDLFIDPDDVRTQHYVCHETLVGTSRGTWIYHIRTRWTGGGGPPRLTVLTPGHELLDWRKDKRPGWENVFSYFVYLGRELSVGEELEVGWILTAVDETQTVVPRLAYHPLTDGPELAQLTVHLPPDRRGSDVMASEWEFVQGEIQQVGAPWRATLTGAATYSQQWSALRRGRLYVLRWPPLYEPLEGAPSN